MMATPLETSSPLTPDAPAPLRPMPAPFANKSDAAVLQARLTLLLGPTLAVALAAALGWVILKSFALPPYRPEMLAAIIINIVSGVAALSPLILLIRRPLPVLLRLVILGMVVRMVLTLAGILLAAGPGWKLALVPLALWTCAMYFVVMATETALSVWVVRR